MGILAGQRYSLADSPRWISPYAWDFWIPTSECSFYHRDRVRRLKACGRLRAGYPVSRTSHVGSNTASHMLPRGQIPLPLEIENTDGEKETA